MAFRFRMMSKAPTITTGPTFAAVEDGLRRADAPTDAAEAHGSLCGLVCALGTSGEVAWLAETLAEARPGDPVTRAAEQLLEELAAATRAALDGDGMTFQPLLPDDAEPLKARVDGLAQWCQGFNHGLFVAARLSGAEVELGSGNTAEVVSDFGEMAQVSVGEEEADAAGEEAYAELVEYVRVSVQLVYEELGAVRQRVQSGAVH